MPDHYIRVPELLMPELERFASSSGIEPGDILEGIANRWVALLAEQFPFVICVLQTIIIMGGPATVDALDKATEDYLGGPERCQERLDLMIDAMMKARAAKNN